MAHRISYRKFASYLTSLPIGATNAELAAKVYAYLYHDGEYQRAATAAIRELPPDGCWLDGLYCLCDWLQSENPRFVKELFVEWVMEEK